MSFPIVDPDSVRSLEIVANVEIGKTISIDVAKHRRKTKIGRRRSERFALGCQKCAIGPGGAPEMPMTVIDVERIGFSNLDHMAVDNLYARGVAARNDVAAIDLPDRNRPATSQDRNLAIIGDVQVQVAVAIDISEGQ